MSDANTNTILTPQQLWNARQEETERNQKIKEHYATGNYSYNKLSRIFKVSPQRIQQIVKKNTTTQNSGI